MKRRIRLAVWFWTYFTTLQPAFALLSVSTFRPSFSTPHRCCTTTALWGDRAVVARRLVGDGMNAFRNGQVERSIDLFNQAEFEDPSLLPYLWQRGLSYYYADEFDRASQQFRTDVRVNPTDAEEIVWDIASQLMRTTPTRNQDNFPVPSQLTLPRNDPRRIMVCSTY